MANVFWLRGDQLFTPSLATGCLPGTTREFVMENTAVTEVDVGTDELREADAIFLTSAGLGVVAVDEFRGRAIGNVEHAILELIPANG
jgi:branched-subunit amino acid aminotransferase/4-amino-4-deoxychorismate lyase